MPTSAILTFAGVMLIALMALLVLIFDVYKKDKEE